MKCGAAEATGMGFVCFVVINPRIMQADLVFFFVSYNCPISPPSRIHTNQTGRTWTRFPDLPTPLGQMMILNSRFMWGGG